MTNEEKIDKIYDVVIGMEPMVKNHENTLYGNGQPGLSRDVVLLKQKQNDCPARKTISSGSKRLNIASIMMVVAIIGLVANAVLGVITLMKK